MIANFTLQPELRGPLYRQVYETLRNAILDGTLKPQQRLPGSRELAMQLNVSRNTVNTAYEMLQAEGYIDSRRGSGFYVIELEHSLTQVAQSNTHSASFTSPQLLPEQSLSQRGQLLAAATRAVPTIINPAFQPGLPDLDQFPYRQWQKCLYKVANNMDAEVMRYHDHGGLPQLKLVLRDYLRTSRGVKCDAEQIIVVNGSQAGLDLVARMCINNGEHIAVENPGYLGARDGFSAAGANLIPIDMDEKGICIESLHAASKQQQIRLLYVTPSYQFPSGTIMSAQRRMEILQWAADNNAFIIEDDYDSELRYAGQPLSCLQGLDRQDRVIYLGTFSKVVFPGLRLGYLVLPKTIARSFAYALRKTGQDPPLLLQAAMAEFIATGYFASHLRKMRKLYGQKQRRLVDLINLHLNGILQVAATEAGMQLAAYYQCPINEAGLLQLASDQQLVLAPLSRYYSPGNDDSKVKQKHGLFLGYAGVPLDELEANILKLKNLISKNLIAKT